MLIQGGPQRERRTAGRGLLLGRDLEEDVAAPGEVRHVAALRVDNAIAVSSTSSESGEKEEERREERGKKKKTHSSQRPRNLLARLDAAELDQSVSGLGQGAADDGRRLGLALGADDGRLALLLGLRAGRVGRGC